MTTAITATLEPHEAWNAIQAERTDAITYDIACKLRDGLSDLGDDGHSCFSYEQACGLLHEAGLSTCLIPMLRSARSKEWTLQLAVIDRGRCDCFGDVRIVDPTGTQAVLSPYALIELRPLTVYAEDLWTCRLDRPWFAAASLVPSIRRILVPKPSRTSDKMGRGFAATEDHEIFLRDFAEQINAHTRIRPAVQLNLKQLRFRSGKAQPECDLLAEQPHA